MKRIKILLLFCIVSQSLIAQKNNQMSQHIYPKALVNYQSFKSLVNEVEEHRAKRLISFDVFSKMNLGNNVIILDTRSAYFYKKKAY